MERLFGASNDRWWAERKGVFEQRTHYRCCRWGVMPTPLQGWTPQTFSSANPAWA
jgi:hypothetical protein